MRNTLVLFGSLFVLAVSAGWTLIQATTANDNTVLLHVDGTWTTRSAPETQRAVVLHPDGTWAYGHLPLAPQASALAVAAYSKPGSASAYVTGDTVPYGIWVNPHTWRQDNEAPDRVFERRFTHVSVRRGAL